MKKLSFALLILVSTSALATSSVGSVSEGLYGPLEFLTRLVDLAAYVTGGLLLMFGLVKFKSHRENPKLVPLTVPIVMVFIGGLLILTPYIAAIFGDSWSAVKQEERGQNEDFINQGTTVGKERRQHERALKRYYEEQQADGTSNGQPAVEDYEDPYSEYESQYQSPYQQSDDYNPYP